MIAVLRRGYARIPGAAVVLGGLVGLGLLVALLRFWRGLGAISNLSDAYPWGLWISFDLLCGVALGAGAFMMAGTVYVLGYERYRPILRPAILTGFLGYVMVVLALLVDLGRPERIWHLIVFWNPHSVLFEVGWCVMLYTTVLALEFSPAVFERFGLKAPLKAIHAITVPLVILGVVLSTLHQSSLGSMFLAMPDKVNPLWYSSLLPVFFFISAAAVGMAMVIFESTISARAFKRQAEHDLLAGLGRALPYVLGAYLTLKIIDLVVGGDLALLVAPRLETLLFWTEITIGVIVPIVLLSQARVRANPRWLFWSAGLVIAGVVINRFNVSLLALTHRQGAFYLPHWMELAVTAGIVSAGILAYWAAARFLPLFDERAHSSHSSAH